MDIKDVLAIQPDYPQITTRDKTETFQLREAQDIHLASLKALFLELFEDEAESLTQLDTAYKASKDENIDELHRPLFYVLTDADEQVVGFRWIERGLGKLETDEMTETFGVAYVPYGGITQRYKDKSMQNQGLYTQIIEVTEQLLKRQGTKVMVTECFQPQKNSTGQDTHYTPAYSTKIMKFFQGNGYQYVDGPYPISGLWGTDTPGEETDWEKQIYSGLKAGIKILDDIANNKLFVTDGTRTIGVTPAFYKSVYDAVQGMVYKKLFSPDTFDERYQNLVATQTFYRFLNEYPDYVPVVGKITAPEQNIQAE